MPCYHPLTGYRGKFINPKTGKRPVVFNLTEGFTDLPISIPCGRCKGCRLEYSRQWAIRCVHEAQMHTQNSFITLIYSNENLPVNVSISKEELQKFFKRFRKKLSPQKIRYFACGEYGDLNNRPHYHAIIFGYDFPDKYLHTIKNDIPYYRSYILEQTWDKGHSIIGEATFESAAYVARYIMKKRKGKDDHQDKNGKTNRQHYELLDKETGEIHQLTPEFCLMSRGGEKGGIGKTWLQKYKSDTDKDFITLRGTKMGLPKYYDMLLEQMYEDIKERKWKRQEKIDKKDNTLERLATKQIVKEASLILLTRTFENGT